MFSEQFRQQLTQGKYTNWATELSEEQLRCVLSIVAEFANRSLGVLELLDKHRKELAGAIRGLIALEAMSRIVVYGERFDMHAWARRIALGRGHLEFGDLPEVLRVAVDRAAPDVKWDLVLMLDDAYELGGKDAREQSIGASVTDDGKVVIKTVVEETAVPEVVRAAVKMQIPAFELHYIQALGPDRKTVHSYQFVVSPTSGGTQKLVVSADGTKTALSK